MERVVQLTHGILIRTKDGHIVYREGSLSDPDNLGPPTTPVKMTKDGKIIKDGTVPKNNPR